MLVFCFAFERVCSFIYFFETRVECPRELKARKASHWFRSDRRSGVNRSANSVPVSPVFESESPIAAILASTSLEEGSCSEDYYYLHDYYYLPLLRYPVFTRYHGFRYLVSPAVLLLFIPVID